jgi:hypothetical protein
MIPGKDPTQTNQHQSGSMTPTSLGINGLYSPTNNPITTGDMSQVVPGRNRDEDSGRFQEEYPPEEVIAAIQNQDGYAGTASVADEIGTTTESAYVKLRAMEDEGYVESQLVGQSRIWEVAEEDIQEE